MVYRRFPTGDLLLISYKAKSKRLILIIDGVKAMQYNGINVKFKQKGVESMEKRIYTVSTAHLDTSWLWTLERTIEKYIPETLSRNFALLEKFPEYVFNFEGSYRYELMEEYYPEQFEKLKGYVAEGRWSPTGSCYENGDVNIPSPEALTRNILYGNGYFREKFGVESNDIFLPDCFGFGRALPSVAAHSGLKGFSTQKLTWGVAEDVPFDVGFWRGNDGNGVWTALKTGAYNVQLPKARGAKVPEENVFDGGRKYDFPRTMLYYGTGDRGGSAVEKSAQQAATEQRENDAHDIKVLNASTKQFFDEIDAMPEDVKKRLPVHDGEFLLTKHGTGSYTSRSVSKRFNRRAELLADAAERAASTAWLTGTADYPKRALDVAWKNVIAHQFHDDITGTSFMECYKRNWNDYVLALHGFSAEYTAAAAAVSAQMNTNCAVGFPVVVNNPLQDERTEPVCVELPENLRGTYYRVFDANGVEVASQMQGRKLLFEAKVPANGWKAYSVRMADTPYAAENGLLIAENSIENENLRVSIDENGDIASVFDKNLNRELLSAPVRLALLQDAANHTWPAWEIMYEDVMAEPYAYAGKPEIRIAANGPVLCALEIKRCFGESKFAQVLSLSAKGRYLRVDNETDWRSEATMLKVVFPLAAENELADYDVGVGCARRPTNTARRYEVPAQKWAGIQDMSGDFSVAVFSDSRTAWDKPDRRTLRLTCVQTPLGSLRWECGQHVMDMGLNRYAFAICGSESAHQGIAAQAEAFCQPMHAFMTGKHDGALGSEFSLMDIDNADVRIMGLKKAQDSDEIILRVVETAGKPAERVQAKFAQPILSAREVRGDEVHLADYPVEDGVLTFGMGKNQIRSFALTFARDPAVQSGQQALELPFDITAVTANDNRSASDLPGNIALPAEITPAELLNGGVHYAIRREGKSALCCKGQTIDLPEGSERVHLLMTSLSGDRKVTFRMGDAPEKRCVQDCFEAVGAWDLIGLGETGYIKHQGPALILTHTHNAEGDMTAKQMYLYTITLETRGASTLTLPADANLVLFAATAEQGTGTARPADAHFDRLEKRPFDYTLSGYAVRELKPMWIERILDRFTDRTKEMEIKLGTMCMVEAKADLYWLLHTVFSGGKRKRRLMELKKQWAAEKE